MGWESARLSGGEKMTKTVTKKITNAMKKKKNLTMTFVPLQERGLGISEIIWRATGKSGTS